MGGYIALCLPVEVIQLSQGIIVEEVDHLDPGNIMAGDSDATQLFPSPPPRADIRLFEQLLEMVGDGATLRSPRRAPSRER